MGFSYFQENKIHEDFTNIKSWEKWKTLWKKKTLKQKLNSWLSIREYQNKKDYNNWHSIFNYGKFEELIIKKMKEYDKKKTWNKKYFKMKKKNLKKILRNFKKLKIMEKKISINIFHFLVKSRILYDIQIRSSIINLNLEQISYNFTEYQASHQYRWFFRKLKNYMKYNAY